VFDEKQADGNSVLIVAGSLVTAKTRHAVTNKIRFILCNADETSAYDECEYVNVSKCDQMAMNMLAFLADNDT